MVTSPHKKNLLIGISIVFFAIVIVGYGLFQARNLLMGPQIYLASPQNGATITHSPLVTIAGKASNISFISLNDRPIFVNEQGDFNEQLLLSPGYNTWTIMAKDTFGRTITKSFSLIFNKT